MDVLHGDEVGAVGLPQLEDLDDVRMGELGGEAGLVEEHLHELVVVGEVREDALDDDELLEALDAMLLGEPDLRHPAGREALEQTILSQALAHDCPPGRLGRFPAGCQTLNPAA